MGQRLHRPSRRARSVTTPSVRLNACNEMQRHPAYISLHIAHRYISERTTQRREGRPAANPPPWRGRPKIHHAARGTCRVCPNPRAGRPTRHHLDGGCVTHRVTDPNPNVAAHAPAQAGACPPPLYATSAATETGDRTRRTPTTHNLCSSATRGNQRIRRLPAFYAASATLPRSFHRAGRKARVESAARNLLRVEGGQAPGAMVAVDRSRLQRRAAGLCPRRQRVAVVSALPSTGLASPQHRTRLDSEPRTHHSYPKATCDCM